MNAHIDGVTELAVFNNNQRIGTLFNTAPLEFAYDAAWLEHPDATPLHHLIPLRPGRTTSPHIHAFFENLLPEGEQRKTISIRYHATSIFGLLATVGGDTAGSVVLLPAGQNPQSDSYAPITWQQVADALHDVGTLSSADSNTSDEQANLYARVSISGAQRKILLSLSSDGAPLRPLGTTPSTHILKPDIERSDAKIFASAFNETIVMRVAQICELPTAPVTYQPLVRACVVERYDRIVRDDGTLGRSWQADFCQLAGKVSTIKYELDGGPSFRECFELLKENAVAPAVDLRNLMRWLFFNLYVGNNDSHAKNLAMLETPTGLRLAPFYDMMCTTVYSGLSNTFAFQIAGEYHPGKLERRHFEELAESIGVSPRFMFAIADNMADQVTRAIPLAIDSLRKDIGVFGNKELILSGRLHQTIDHTVKRMRNKILGHASRNHRT